jgi:hypothetical protein
MVSLHFRKCRQAFQDGLDADKGYDVEMMDWICRWALLAERLKATEEKIRRIRSGKISSDQLLERAHIFKNEPRGKRPQRDPQQIRKAASLPVKTSFAAEMLRQRRDAERKRIREERAREKEKNKKGPDEGFRGARPFPPLPITPESIRALLLEDAESRRDTEAIRKIREEDPAALAARLKAVRQASDPKGSGGLRKKTSAPSRSGPSDDVRKKLREQRKKKKK